MKTAEEVRAAVARAPASSRPGLAPVRGPDWMNFASEERPRRFDADYRLKGEPL